MEDITSLQNALTTNVTDSVTSGVQDQIGKIIMWIVVPTVILSVLILLLYILHVLRRRKVENAIFEIRDLLRDWKVTQAQSVQTQLTPASGQDLPAVSKTENGSSAG